MTLANPETEWLVLGALLDAEGPVMKSAASALLASCGVRRDDFTVPAARAWFLAIETLVGRERPVDAGTVWSVSRGQPGVPQDGHGKLQALQSANTCTRAALATHALELRRLRKLRELEGFHRRQLEAVMGNGADPAALAGRLDNFSRNFAGTEDDFGTGDADLLELAEEWDASIRGERKAYLPTGIEALDEVMMGWEENLNVIGGPPSAGKSALLTACIYNALLDGHRIAVFGLEDGTKWIAKRLVSRRTGLPVKAVGKTRLHDHQADHLQAVMGDLSETLKTLLTFKQGGIGTARLLQLCKKAISVHRARAIFIDHGLEIQHEGVHRGDEMRMRVQNTFAQLRDLAVATHTPIVVVVHFNRIQGKSDGPPTMHDFAECAGIERMARLALGLWEKESDGADAVRCTVLKQTEGEKNVHLLLQRETKHALIANGGGKRLDLKAEKQAALESRRGKGGAKPWGSPTREEVFGDVG